jgi:hypothetical protein
MLVVRGVWVFVLVAVSVQGCGWQRDTRYSLVVLVEVWRSQIRTL